MTDTERNQNNSMLLRIHRLYQVASSILISAVLLFVVSIPSFGTLLGAMLMSGVMMMIIGALGIFCATHYMHASVLSRFEEDNKALIQTVAVSESSGIISITR